MTNPIVKWWNKEVSYKSKDGNVEFNATISALVYIVAFVALVTYFSVR